MRRNRRCVQTDIRTPHRAIRSEHSALTDDPLRHVVLKTEPDLEVALRHAAYSIDAICVGSLSCGDRTLPSVIPTKNITASITPISPSFRGGLSLRICLSKSSSSRRFILEVPIFVPNETQLRSIGNAAKLSLFH